MKNNFKKRAFTLIEISIVLVIIGIILASVMKGRDLIKGSQIKEFNQVFVSQWETIANSYFSRMGAVMGDGEANGGTSGATADGFIDGEDTNTSLQEKLTQAGIDISDLVKSDVNDPFKRSVDGEFAGKSTVELAITHYTINNKKKNVLVFKNIPGDIAQAIDTIRDGRPDGKKGSIVAMENNNTTAAGAEASLVEWYNETATTRNMVLILEH
ncbi:MAG: prepilin-type N-terminal cleavage/methylation domain-containing protein [Campylobacterota bacterium]|nr:prepilin-type N-terminal cleavage/methylation domain-containing protein [Campylobacterota bacterium]